MQAEYKSLLATASLLATTPTARAPRNYSASLPPVPIARRWTRCSPTLLTTAAVALIAFALIDLQGPRLGQADRSSVVTELEITLAVASPSDSIETAVAAPAAAPASRKAEDDTIGAEPEPPVTAAAAPDEAPAVEVMTVAESSPAEAAGADATIADDFGEDAAAPDAPIAAAGAESTDRTAPSLESVAVPPPVMPDPRLEFDPVWLATLAAGGALLITAGFASVFRPR